jgi:hypothetical protein
MIKHSGSIWIDGVPVDGVHSASVRTIVATDDGEMVCMIRPGMRAEANGDLIKAAPRMLALLRNILSDLPSNKDWLDPTIEAEAKLIVGTLIDDVPVIMPSDSLRAFVEVCCMHDGNPDELPLFSVVGCSGNVTTHMMETVENDFSVIAESDEWASLCKCGQGCYLFEVIGDDDALLMQPRYQYEFVRFKALADTSENKG